MDKYYCFYCASQFLNAASLVKFVPADGNAVVISERGYQTIRNVQELLEINSGSHLEINQVITRTLYAETMVDGCATCMDHLYEAMTFRFKR